MKQRLWAKIWFDMRQDPKMRKRISGDEFRCWVFLLLEYSEQLKTKNLGQISSETRVKLDQDSLRDLFMISHHNKLENLLQKFEDLGLVIIHKMDTASTTLSIPKWVNRQFSRTAIFRSKPVPSEHPEEHHLNDAGDSFNTPVRVSPSKRIDKDSPIPPPVVREKKAKPAGVDPDLIEAIYQAYPKKVGKGAAIKAITKAAETVDPEKLLSDVEDYADSRSVDTTPARYIPNPATWFNQGRWDDDRLIWDTAYGEEPEKIEEGFYRDNLGRILKRMTPEIFLEQMGPGYEHYVIPRVDKEPA